MNDHSENESSANTIREVLAISENFILKTVPDPHLYKIVAVENLLHEFTEDGQVIWFVTYKPIHLIPSVKNPELGAGGEIFLTINSRDGSVIKTSYGE